MLNIKKLFAKSLPAIKTVSGTTDNNGNISLSLSKSGARAIISVDGSNYSYIPFVYQGNWYAKVVSSSPTHPAIVNVHVDIEISYIRGGYFVTSIMSTIAHCLERRWSYVERKENAYQNIGYADSKGYNARNCSRVYNRELGLYGIKCICKKIWAYCQHKFHGIEVGTNACWSDTNNRNIKKRILPYSKFGWSICDVSRACRDGRACLCKTSDRRQRWKWRSGDYNVSAGLTISERGWACA